MPFFTRLANYIFSPVDASGAQRSVMNADTQVWGTEIERLIMALVAEQGGDIDLPNLLIRFTVTGGTTNDIEATANLPIPSEPGLALFSIQIAQDNTGPVTINGKPWLTNVGNQFVAGGIKSGGIYLFLDNGDHYRAVTDQDVSALVADAEAASDRAEGFAAMLSADKIKFKTVLLLLADTSMSYTADPGKIQVGPGDVIEAQGFRYEVVDASDPDAWLIATAGGVKLSSVDDAPPPEAFAAIGNGVTDDTAALVKWVAYHVARGLRFLNLRPRLYLVDELVVPDETMVFGNGATVMRRVNRAYPLVLIGKRSVVRDLIVNGRADVLGGTGGGTRMTGISLDDYAKAINCESYNNARHGIGSRTVADQLQYTGIEIHSCYAHDNGLNPGPSGSGDDFNMTNCADWVARDCRSKNAARNGITVTTYNTGTGETDPALTGWGLIDNFKVSGSGYIPVDIEIAPKCRVINFDNPGAEISCRGSADVEIRDTRCAGITATNSTSPMSPADRVKVLNARIENNARSSSLLVLEGADIVADNIRCKSTATPSSNMVVLRASNSKGIARNIHVDGANNGIVVDVDNISGLSGENVSGVQVRYGPAVNSSVLTFASNLKVNAGIAEIVSTAAPTTGTWARHSRVRGAYSSGNPTYWQCSVAGAPGTWVAGPNWP